MSIKMRLTYYLLFLGALLASAEVIQLDSGNIEGLDLEDHKAWIGIPYLQPPVKHLRFAPPVPIKSWAPETLQTRSFKPGCPQRCVLPEGACPTVQDEDCLYINVYSPTNMAKNIPVIVWIPGGHFEQGSSGTPLYYGDFFTTNQSKVVLVTVNYRLGALGWLTDDTISEVKNGNLGLYDVVESLRWVQRNIAAFGGNPDQVTIAGQSAGATIIAALSVSPIGKGLFNKVILMSNPITLPFRYQRDASTLGTQVRNILKCGAGDIECLRSKSVQEIVDAQHQAADHIQITQPLVSMLPWSVTVDGRVVPARFLDAIKSGKVHKDTSGNPLPLIIGSITEETLIFIYMASKEPLNTIKYVAAVGDVFTTSAPKVLFRYPPHPFVGDKRNALAYMGTHYVFSCPNRFAAGLWNSKSTFLYMFDNALSFDAWGDKYDYCRGRVCHGADLPILFHQSGNMTMSVKESRLSSEMLAYWTNFAYTGDPNGPNLPQWPSYNKTDPSLLRLKVDGSVVEKNYLKIECDFFDSLGYRHGAG
ncbi:cAMP-regulated D2 protein [Acrasis kona]|uniref:Carboxylic ester hydrolase n=1 Tax=Acrasis kona TaxID=1008807 RepID=A0AAW2Z204_9EUKA